MRKGLHIIRALFPELKGMKLCGWCGEDIGATRGDWLGSYTPRAKKPRNGLFALCWSCALRCSELEGQPEFPGIFNMSKRGVDYSPSTRFRNL